MKKKKKEIGPLRRRIGDIFRWPFAIKERLGDSEALRNRRKIVVLIPYSSVGWQILHLPLIFVGEKEREISKMFETRERLEKPKGDHPKPRFHLSLGDRGSQLGLSHKGPFLVDSGY